MAATAQKPSTGWRFRCILPSHGRAPDDGQIVPQVPVFHTPMGHTLELRLLRNQPPMQLPESRKTITHALIGVRAKTTQFEPQGARKRAVLMREEPATRSTWNRIQS